jgi:hypothetical protein
MDMYTFSTLVLLGFALSFHFCFGGFFFIDLLSTRRSRAEAPHFSGKGLGAERYCGRRGWN